MKLRDTLAGVARELRLAGVESPEAEAEILVAAVVRLLDEPRSALHRTPDRPLTSAEARTLARLVLRRCAGEPVQYLVGRAWFRDLTLEVGPGVLIPRPETEILVEEVLAGLRGRTSPAPPRILDLGTGSGCIALSVAFEWPGARAIATDLSVDALAWARKNRDRVAALRPDLHDRVELVAGDLLAPFRAGARFDAVASNPPYVAREQAESLPREVREHEPEVALVAGDRGFGALASIVERAHEFLEPGGVLALEVGEGQADNVAGRIAAQPHYGLPRVVKDLAGRPRIVLAARSAAD